MNTVSRVAPGCNFFFERERMKVLMSQGTSARLVNPAVLGERRVWQEIQNLRMRFVILKVRNSVSRGPFTLYRVHLDCGIDQPGSINLVIASFTIYHMRFRKVGHEKDTNR